MSVLETRRLYLTEIILTNYRTYMGHDNKIEFSPEPKKPFTIIHGVSGEGKTTLLNALYWCLYGKEREQNKILTDDTSEGIVNSQMFNNLELGESGETSVELYIFENEHPQYHILRKIITTKNTESGQLKKNDDNSALTLSNFTLETSLFFEEWVGDDKNGELKEAPEKIAENVIRREFPEVLAEYLLFDAELLDSFEKNKSDDLVKKGIEEITGLPILKKAIVHLDDFIESLDDKAGEGDANYTALSNRKKNAKKIIEENSLNIEKNNKIVDEKKARIKQIDETLIKKDEKTLTEKTLLREKTELSKKHWNEKLVFAQINQKQLIEDNLWKFMLKKTLEVAKTKFDGYEADGLIPPTIGKDAYEKIIENTPHQCVICENIIEEDSEIWSKILIKSKKTIDNASLREITLGRGHISNMIRDTNRDEMKERYQKILEVIETCRTKMQEDDSEIEKINLFISELGSTEEDISNLNSERSDIEDENKDLYKTIGGFERLRDGAQSILNDVEPKLRLARKSKEKDTLNESKMNIDITTLSLIKKAISELTEDFKNIASESTANFFLQFAPRKEDFSGVKIQKNYVVRGLDDKGNPKKVSAGQAHALGLSYLTAVRKIMKKNYFMIIDSPFHNISQKTRNGFVDLCDQIAPGTQITLLVTDGEYTATVNEKISGPPIPSIRNHLKSKDVIWREYILDVICDVCGKLSDGHKKIKDGFDHNPISKTVIRIEDGNE